MIDMADEREDTVVAHYHPARGNRPRHLTISIPSGILQDLAQANRHASASDSIAPASLTVGSSSLVRTASGDASYRNTLDASYPSGRRPSMRRAAQSHTVSVSRRKTSLSRSNTPDSFTAPDDAPPAYPSAATQTVASTAQSDGQAHTLRPRAVSASWRGDGNIILGQGLSSTKSTHANVYDAQLDDHPSNRDSGIELGRDGSPSTSEPDSEEFHSDDMTSTSISEAFEGLALPPDEKIHSIAYAKGTRSRSGTATLTALKQAAQIPLSRYWLRLFLTFVIFALSSMAVIYLVASIPTLKLPYTLGEVKDQTYLMKNYAGKSWQNTIHVAFVLACLMTWKQSFSIPGSAIMNIILGAMYGTLWATIFASFLTALGSTVSYGLARMCSPFVERYMIKGIAYTRRAVETNRGNLFSYLLLARLFPLLPYSVLNIASGVLGLPLGPYAMTLFIGSIPYNYVTCNIGSLLSSLGQLGDDEDWRTLLGPSFYFQVVGVCLVSTLPVLFKDRISRLARRTLGDGPASRGSLPQYRRNSSHPFSFAHPLEEEHFKRPSHLASTSQRTVITLQALDPESPV